MTEIETLRAVAVAAKAFVDETADGWSRSAKERRADLATALGAVPAPTVRLDYPRPIEILAAEFKKRSEGPGRVWTSSRAYENAYRDGLMRAIELLQDPRSDSGPTPERKP